MLAFVCLLLLTLIASSHANLMSSSVSTTTKPTITSITGCRGQLTSCQPQLAITLTGPTFFHADSIVHGPKCPFQIQLSVRSAGSDGTIYACANPQFGRLPLSLVCLLPKVDNSLIGREFSVRVIDQYAHQSSSGSFDEASDWNLALSYDTIAPAIDPAEATIEELESLNASITRSLHAWQIVAIVLAVTLMIIIIAGLVRMYQQTKATKQDDTPLLSDVAHPSAGNQIRRSKQRTNPSPFAPILKSSRPPIRQSFNRSINRSDRSVTPQTVSSPSTAPKKLAPLPPVVRVYQATNTANQPSFQPSYALEIGYPS